MESWALWAAASFSLADFFFVFDMLLLLAVRSGRTKGGTRAPRPGWCTGPGLGGDDQDVALGVGADEDLLHDLQAAVRFRRLLLLHAALGWVDVDDVADLHVGLVVHAPAGNDEPEFASAQR